MVKTVFRRMSLRTPAALACALAEPLPTVLPALHGCLALPFTARSAAAGQGIIQTEIVCQMPWCDLR
jgi:hypothetical protein